MDFKLSPFPRPLVKEDLFFWIGTKGLGLMSSRKKFDVFD